MPFNVTSRVRALVAAVLGGSCAREPAPVVPVPPPAPVAAAAPCDALAQLDSRTPLPLQPMMANHQKQNMREHLEAVQDIVQALGTDDFGTIERAAGRLGFSQQMGQMCTRMGAGAAGFTEQALAFHHTADRIATAAKERNRAQVLVELSATLKACTTCHAAWKQQVVDEPTWTRLSATTAPMDLQSR
jgi:hypothetical protein